MTYDKAFEIGSAATGYVKCTYARLYNAENGVMFSLQHNDIIGVTNVNTDARITFDIDLPVVEAVRYVPGERSVPVRLTTAARDLIRTKLRNYKRTDNIQDLLRVVENREVCYVPASAIDWIPDNIENATVINPTTGTEIKLSDRIADAKKKVENAKAILAMAATTIII